MASAAESAAYAQDAADVIEELRESGRVLSFGIRPDGARPSDPAGEYQEVGLSNALSIPLETVNGFRIDSSSDIDPSYRYYLVSNETDLRQCSHVRIDGDVFQLQHIEDGYDFDGITDILYFIGVCK